MSDKVQQNSISRANSLLQSGKLEGKYLIAFFEHYSDIIFNPLSESNDIIHFYCEGMIDTTQLNEYQNKIISFLESGRNDEVIEDLPPIQKINNMEKAIEKLFSGYFIFFKNFHSHFYVIDISNIPSRTPEESKTEISMKGPRDGFTEEIQVNVALIRKRIKNEALYNENYEIGTLSKTKISLMYLRNKINENTLTEIQSRLKNLETECIIGSGQLEQWLSDRTFSIFPHLDYITRPDYAIECLARGRFVLIVDGSPSILIGPTNLFSLLKSPEDIHYPYFIVIFQRLIRLLGLFISIFAPGLYIAITNVNLDQLPFALLATIVVSREGLPLSLSLEAFFILILFELLREAGIRMPTAVGQTVSIVGGLIIGDAAIRAGMVSPTLLVVIAISAVSTFTLVNQSLTGTVTILRIFCMLISTYLGVYGAILTFLTIIIYLAQLESFRLSYLEPISSLNFKQYMSGLVTNPLNRKKFSPSIFNKRRR